MTTHPNTPLTREPFPAFFARITGQRWESKYTPATLYTYAAKHAK